jgi:hypothetical protein
VTGRAPSMAARTLVARSRRPARPAGAAPAFRLAEGSVLAPPQGGPAPAAMPAAASAPPPASHIPATAVPAAQAPPPQTAARQAVAWQAVAPEAMVPPPAAGASIPPGAPAPAGESLRYPEAVTRAATGSPPAGPAPLLPSTEPAVPAAPRAPARATGPASPGPPPAPVPPAGRAMDTSESPRTQAPPGPDVQGRVWAGEPVVPASATGANPLVARASRPARSVKIKRPDDGAVGPAGPRPAGPVTAEPPTPERSPALPGPPAGTRAAPGHPPVTIGEIHVHVAEPPSAAADPLALLAPYARGLTARRDGAW